MQDIRQRERELLRRVWELPQEDSESYEEDLAAWNQAWEELLSDLSDMLQLSLESQFPGRRYRQDRENALQVTLMNFYRKTVWNYDPEKEGPSGLLGYLGKIAYREMVSQLKEAGKLELSESEVFAANAVDHRSERELRELVFKDLLAWLESHAPEDEQKVLHYRVRMGMTFQQIADKVDRPLSSVYDSWKRLCNRAARLEIGDQHE